MTPGEVMVGTKTFLPGFRKGIAYQIVPYVRRMVFY